MKCPDCHGVLPYVNLEEVPVHVNGVPQWRGVSYVCPLCFAAIGCQIDPVALNADTQKKIISTLQSNRR
jgi:hypothetical protein